MRILAFLSVLGCASALVYEQVAFDSAQVCFWGFVPPDLTCPVLKHHVLSQDVLGGNDTALYRWKGGDQCEDGICLYWNRGFAGGRGIAVLTGADQVQPVKAAGDILLSLQISLADSSNLPYHTAEVTGRESGIIADKKLARGDPIMGYPPVLLVHQSFYEELPLEKQQSLLDLAIDSLPPPTRDMLISELSHIPTENRGLSTLSKKAFLLDLGGADGRGHHYGSFPEVSRLNHNCRPNAAFYVDPVTLMHITTAARTIGPGDEINISYLNPLAPHTERQSRAQEIWGIECKCSQCSLPTDEVAESDSRLSEIKWIEGQLSDFDSQEVTVGLISYLLQHHGNERLEAKLARAYTLAALNMNSLGYEKRAAKFAQLAIDAALIENGGGSSDAKMMKELLEGPEAHSSYRVRVDRDR